MKFVAPIEINSILGLVYTNARVNLVNESKLEQGTEISLEFGDFIRSQLRNKIIECDFKSLICSTVHMRDIIRNNKEVTEQMHKSISNVYHEFIQVGVIAAIYLHLKYEVKLNLTLSKKLNNYLTRDINEVDNKILVFQSSNVITNLESYEDILYSKSLMVLNYGEIDYMYLTRLLISYNYSIAGTCAMWEEGIC